PGLPHIHDGAVPVLEQVYARLRGQRLELLLQRHPFHYKEAGFDTSGRGILDWPLAHGIHSRASGGLGGLESPPSSNSEHGIHSRASGGLGGLESPPSSNSERGIHSARAKGDYRKGWARIRPGGRAGWSPPS